MGEEHDEYDDVAHGIGYAILNNWLNASQEKLRRNIGADAVYQITIQFKRLCQENPLLRPAMLKQDDPYQYVYDYVTSNTTTGLPN